MFVVTVMKDVRLYLNILHDKELSITEAKEILLHFPVKLVNTEFAWLEALDGFIPTIRFNEHPNKYVHVVSCNTGHVE